MGTDRSAMARQSRKRPSRKHQLARATSTSRSSARPKSLLSVSSAVATRALAWT